VSGPDEHISKQFLIEIFNIFNIRRFNFFKNIKSFSNDEVLEENKNLIVSDNTKIIIQPCGAKAKINFENTIINKADLSKYDLAHREASVWGVHKEKYFEDLNIGDNVYFGDTTGLFYRGKVCYKTINEQIANDLWGNLDFKYIYILSSVEKTEIELSIYNKAVGYNPVAPIQAFRILDAMKSKMFIEAFGMII
jgi:hypothetical protein